MVEEVSTMLEAAETIIEYVVDDLFIRFKQSFNLESDSHDYM